MYRVLLNSVEKVRRFVNITSGFDANVLLRAGQYIIDAKSIMGIFSMDLTKPMEMVFAIDGKCSDEDISKYQEMVSEFAV